MVMEPIPECEHVSRCAQQGLDRQARGLVRLAALLVLGAPATSLRWAVDLACANGVSDDAVVGALVAAAAAAGSAQAVADAPRLALALDLDIEPDDDRRPARIADQRGSPTGDGP
jgi:alkylhydroperoxidase/carboxymuconolactone decarboxylase family protein YurZ